MPPATKFLVTVLSPLIAAQVMIGTPAVYDGDTFAFGDDVIRLFGIDAPERMQTCQGQGGPWDCGEAAKLRLQELISKGGLQCQQRDRDRYDRTVAACRAGGRDLGLTLVSEGLAIALPEYSRDYIAAEARAREQTLGIWGGTFQTPADYRAENANDEIERPRPSESARVTITPRGKAPPSEVYYRNCAAARAAGATPLLRGQPGYRSEIDSDGDGVACEPIRR